MDLPRWRLRFLGVGVDCLGLWNLQGCLVRDWFRVTRLWFVCLG